MKITTQDNRSKNQVHDSSSSYLRHIERNLDVRHGAQVVDLLRLDIGNNGDEIGSIAQISVVEEKLDSSFVAVAVDVIDTSSVEGGGTTDNAVDLYIMVVERREMGREVEKLVSKLGENDGQIEIKQSRLSSIVNCAAWMRQCHCTANRETD